MFHLVVHGRGMLTGAEVPVTVIAVTLASAAGVSQLFSP